MTEKYKKDDFEKIIAESLSLTDALLKLNLRPAGGNFKTIKKYINKYQIDTTHFESIADRSEKIRNNGKLRKIPIENILITNSTYQSNKLKLRLYQEGLKLRICELCGQGEEWNGKKMALILDHINGIHNDNRLINLRIVCPNCNATLETHCGKNTGKRNLKLKEMGYSINDFIDFRTIITDEVIQSKINRRKVVRPDYVVLINDINELGYRSTGRKYGVSDNAIRKWVKNYEKNGF